MMGAAAGRLRRRWVGLLLGGGAACVTGETLSSDALTIQGQLDEARRRGAYRCAPLALAEAEAHLEFLKGALHRGDSVRAQGHRDRSKAAMLTALDRSKGCVAPDADGDGVPDSDDRCPREVGLESLLGCPDVDGDGLADRDDTCPTLPGPATSLGCPDEDGDAIPDPVDRCRAEPEDFDGHDDEDGCPEEDPVRDTDGDGLLDPDDACPLEPETPNGVDDEDGCPDVKLDLVEIDREAGRIALKRKVFFDTGRASIKPVSYGLLTEVAEALKAFPRMKVVIEGHTDSVGSSRVNLRISQARAEAVRDYLIAQGIPPERLIAIGFGEDKPLDTNRTRAGRDRNRRVDFTISAE